MSADDARDAGRQRSLEMFDRAMRDFDRSTDKSSFGGLQALIETAFARRVTTAIIASGNRSLTSTVPMPGTCRPNRTCDGRGPSLRAGAPLVER